MSNNDDNQPIATRTRSKRNTNGTTTTTNLNDTVIDFLEGDEDSNERDRQQKEQVNNETGIIAQPNADLEKLMIEMQRRQQIIEQQQHALEQLQWNIQHLTTKPELKLDNIESGMITCKYDNFIEQQLLKEKINNIRKFSGNKDEDVDDWLLNIEHDFSATHVSDNIKLKIIPKGLTQDAHTWYEQNKHRITSWNIFKIEIRERFQSSLHMDLKFSRLKERKQLLRETGAQFIDAMEKLCFQVNPTMTEQEKMAHIKAGLKPSLKEKVFDKQPTTMKQLRDVIKRSEDIGQMINHEGTSNDSQSSEITKPEQLTHSLNSIQDTRYGGNAYGRRRYDGNGYGYDYGQTRYDGNQYYPQRHYPSRWYQYNNAYGYQPEYKQDHNQSPLAPRSNTNNYQKKY